MRTLLCFLLLTTPVMADSFQIRDTTSALDGAIMLKDNSTFNYGANVILGVKGPGLASERSNWIGSHLLDDSLPDNTVSDSGFLTLNISSNGLTGGNEYWLRLARCKKTVGEGDNTGSAADAGEVSWDSSQTGTEAWASGGGLGAADKGADEDSVLLTSASSGSIKLYFAPASLDSARTAAGNLGWILYCTGDAVTDAFSFHSDDAAVVADRFDITVYHTPPGGEGLTVGPATLGPGSYGP